MSNSFESIDSAVSEPQATEPKGWVKVGVLAAATAFTGGLLAVWWYRQTITKLREAEENAKNPHFGIPEDHPSDEV